MNRKMTLFYDKLDSNATTMKNLKLTNELQMLIRSFFMKTQSGLNDQEELTQFLKFTPPSLKNKVIKYIFKSAAKSNRILGKSENFTFVLENVLSDIKPQLLLPEDIIIRQNEDNKNLWLIINGKCEVDIIDFNMKKMNFKTIL